MSLKQFNRVRRSYEKNAPEVKALISGQLPSFVAGHGAASASEPPVFAFHAVEPHRFERQLRYLRDNGYYSVNADELEQLIRTGGCDGRAVALTFDDATWSFWSYAYPLLKKYRFQAILFAIPGLVPTAEPEPNLEDCWQGRRTLDELQARQARQPLCSWAELQLMQASGWVDIQSHSLLHARIPIAPKLVDFLRPDFDTDTYGNVNVPLSSLDCPLWPQRSLRLGAPVFASASRLAGRPRFKENPELAQALTHYVVAQGGRAFFQQRGWERALLRYLRQWPSREWGVFESIAQMEQAIRRELMESRRLLEIHLAKPVRHFCYPWYQGSALTDRLAHEAGYRTLHYGLLLSPRTATPPLRIRRVSEEYLFRLPGRERVSYWSIWKRKLQRSMGA